MRSGYGVSVFKNGEAILTIDSSMLSGQQTFTDEEVDAIRDAAEHLLSFIGPVGEQECFACGGFGECKTNCPLGSINNI